MVNVVLLERTQVEANLFILFSKQTSVINQWTKLYSRCAFCFSQGTVRYTKCYRSTASFTSSVSSAEPTAISTNCHQLPTESSSLGESTNVLAFLCKFNFVDDWELNRMHFSCWIPIMHLYRKNNWISSFLFNFYVFSFFVVFFLISSSSNSHSSKSLYAKGRKFQIPHTCSSSHKFKHHPHISNWSKFRRQFRKRKLLRNRQCKVLNSWNSAKHHDDW